MAEAEENTDVGDPYLHNLNIKPARHINRQSQLDAGGKDLRKRGFNKLRVVVLEAVFGENCMRGSGILCPSVDTWTEYGEEIDEFETGYDFQWILTAAHCVCTQKRSRCRLPDRMRIRIPKYKQWPSKKLKTFRPGRLEALESKRFEDILYDAEQIKKYVHVYEPYIKYFGTGSKLGEDFALIQIAVHKSSLPLNTFQIWDTSKRPDGFSIVGFPAEQEKAYLPYFDSRQEEFSEFEVSPRDSGHAQMYYTSVTSGGQSGGPVQFSNFRENYRAVVGVHVTGKDTDDGEASGCMITKKISMWVDAVQKEAVQIEGAPDLFTTTSSQKAPVEKKQKSASQVANEEEVKAKEKAKAPASNVKEVSRKVEDSKYLGFGFDKSVSQSLNLNSNSKAGSNFMNEKWGRYEEILYDDLEILEIIGKGAYGNVRKAKWLGTEVAVKMVRGDNASFLSELDIFVQLQHPRVCRMYGVTFEPTTKDLYAISHYYRNGSIYDYFKNGNEVSLREKYKMILHASQGVQYLHTKNVIHRDLAARNLLLDANLDVVVSDFGLSRQIAEGSVNKTTTSIGPVRWMALESILHQEYSEASDCWMLGVVIWEILSDCATPFESKSPQYVILKVSTGKSLTPDPSWDRRVQRIIRRCFDEEPKKRPIALDISRLFDKLLGPTPGKLTSGKMSTQETTPTRAPGYDDVGYVDTSGSAYINTAFSTGYDDVTSYRNRAE